MQKTQMRLFFRVGGSIFLNFIFFLSQSLMFACYVYVCLHINAVDNFCKEATTAVSTTTTTTTN